MNKPYSDRRWWDDPRGYASVCPKCIYHYGFGKCEKYPDGIPREVLKQSFPGTENYNKKYCEFRKEQK